MPSKISAKKTRKTPVKPIPGETLFAAQINRGVLADADAKRLRMGHNRKVMLAQSLKLYTAHTGDFLP